LKNSKSTLVSEKQGLKFRANLLLLKSIFGIKPSFVNPHA